MTTGHLPLCASCVHYVEGVEDLLGAGRPAHCAAFPDIIPEMILVGGLDHRQEMPGDHGIRYALRAGAGNLLIDWEVAHARAGLMEL